MKLTNYLLAAILAVLLLQFQPEFVKTAVLLAVVGGAVYGCYWMVRRLPAKLKQARQQRRQEEHDEREFWEHKAKQDALRAKYDPKGVWNEATSVPSEYLAEVRQLNLRYRTMLQRRNGWTASDFDER